MAGGGFLSSIITMAVDKLHTLASPSTTSSSSSPCRNIEQEMSKLGETMRRIQAKLDDSEEENRVKSPSMKLWLSELKDVAYDAEDIVEEYEYKVLRSKQLHESNNGTYEDELANKAAEIRKRFDEITKEWKFLKLPKKAGKRKRSPSPLVRNRETGSLVFESDVLGRKEEKDMLVKWLLSEDDTTGNRVSVIAVIGMGGLGKTTLAQLVYNDHRVKCYFDLTGWVCVSENFHVVSLTEKILQSFTKVKVHEKLDELQRALQKNLKGKKFLLILDDVWNEEFTLWDELRKPLVSAQVGKVIVTTRNQPVARIMQTRSPLNLNCLPFDVCWSLFKKVTLGGAHRSLPPDLEDIAWKIVEKCKGLPLATKLIGGALRNEEDKDSWTEIIENEIWELDDRNIEVLPALKISYDCMPIQLKRCFQYLSLFPKDTHLPSKRIVRLWMSQGLLPLNEDDKDKRAEDIGRNYIKRLAEKSMIHLNGGSFYLHDLVHDLAQNVAQDECLCVIDDKFNTKKLTKIRHLSVNIHKASREDPHPLKHLETIKDLQQLKHMRTLFIKVGDEPWVQPLITRQDKNFEILDNLLQKLKYIRTLNLSHIGITKLPDSLGNLKLLRYLSIEDTYVKSFPESICSLYHLQTLNMQSTKISELPRDIGNLKKLRHLFISDQVAVFPSAIGNLTNLQTLTNFNVSCEEERWDIGELKSLMIPAESPLKTKRFLDSLRLNWLEHFSHIHSSEQYKKRAEQLLEYLHPHVNLQSLYISKYPGVRFVGWVGASSFTKLTCLTLFNCKNCSQLPPLGQLPSLEELYMIGMDGVQHVGREFCSMPIPSPSFPSLKHLEFRKMPNWKAWEGVEIDDFPILHSIKISECSKFPHAFVVFYQVSSCLRCLLSTKWHDTIVASLMFQISIQRNKKLKSAIRNIKQLLSLKILAIRMAPLLKDFTSLNSIIIGICPRLELDKLPANLIKSRSKAYFVRKTTKYAQYLDDQGVWHNHIDDDNEEDLEIEELMELNDNDNEDDMEIEELMELNDNDNEDDMEIEELMELNDDDNDDQDENDEEDGDNNDGIWINDAWKTEGEDNRSNIEG